MTTKNGVEIIALEEHYWDTVLTDTYTGRNATRRNELVERLYDRGQLRLQEMDEVGIDVQVLSHGAPSAQRLDADTGPALARQANDNLHATVQANPDRFAAFAALATANPGAAADELDRCVSELGFKGAMIHGLTNGRFCDGKEFWPIYARAEKLGVPIYMHPGYPHPNVIETYYKDYIEEFPTLATAGWGYTVETATQAIRLVLSGVFDAHPGLQVVLGHMGEGLPFLLWRIDQALSRKENVAARSFREIFEAHFHITTSGNFSNPALLCSVQELGVDRIMFSVDYPFVENAPAVDWIDNIPLCKEDVAKILSGNVRRLLKL